MRLAGSAHDKNFRLALHDQLVSTNDEALSRARAGDQGQLWVVAETQSGGRGRNGRNWSSPPGNLYASLLLIDPAPACQAAELGFVVSVALAEALREILAGDSRLAIKWPNDILFAGAKLAGILLESAHLPDGRLACVAGVGVNCNSHPNDALYKTTDLGVILGKISAPETLFEQLSAQMVYWLGVWRQGGDFASIRERWLSLAAGIGKPVKVARPTGPLEGVFRTIDETGRLVLDCGPVEVLVEAGDVFLLAQPGGARAGL
ncbi:biotin--[acetyl-CoA-carboxylase] ligase [Methylocapsa palsarum]|uniref:biotin--[biotin carboxyl-carrier protein] ligase n=1 Tax=Methylocapsa palsarum TaxID=1612308 RepID=A0A1I3X341_9HYPH|nr:biotin--[acetyl-CoA-carboxylase] ligase [Methylocapsa palsarum]SFK14014.1 BirA family transcriptional regulator, biotin operon repressor / biotin-[acetyl-CoA-carboxylase] ligase [Methylocapsa palsarum]